MVIIIFVNKEVFVSAARWAGNCDGVDSLGAANAYNLVAHMAVVAQKAYLLPAGRQGRFALGDRHVAL